MSTTKRHEIQAYRRAVFASESDEPSGTFRRGRMIDEQFDPRLAYHRSSAAPPQPGSSLVHQPGCVSIHHVVPARRWPVTPAVTSRPDRVKTRPAAQRRERAEFLSSLPPAADTSEAGAGASRDSVVAFAHCVRRACRHEAKVTVTAAGSVHRENWITETEKQ